MLAWEFRLDYRRASVESRSGAGADANRRPVSQTPLIKPDVRISRIRLSDWLHRRLTNARPLALRRRQKVSSHGTRQFPEERVYGPLGVLRLPGNLPLWGTQTSLDRHARVLRTSACATSSWG